MNGLFSHLQASSLWQVAGWTMCYFLILGTLIALVGAVVRFLCNRAAPPVRYATSLAVFAALAISPIGIAAWLTRAMPTTTTAQSAAPQTQPPIDLAKIPPPAGQEQIVPPSGWDKPPTAAPQPTPEQSHPEDGTMYALKRAVAYLPWLWLVGAPLTFALLATGLVGSERLRRTCEPIKTGTVVETLERLRTSLGVSKRVAIAPCDRIAQPILVGIVRPLILLPSSAITGWSSEQLEMVLLHELAHVRRWDNLVNLLQRIVESLLFFHPAVWLVSRQVRRDREQCCDAVVVAHTAKPQAYAALLVSIAAKSSNTSALATASAMADHPLTARIRRILKLEDEPMLVSRKTLGFVGLAILALVAAAMWQPVQTTIAEEPQVKNQEKVNEEKKRIVILYSVSDLDRVPLLEWTKLTNHNDDDGASIRWGEDLGDNILIEATQEQHTQIAELLDRDRKGSRYALSNLGPRGPQKIQPGDQIRVEVEGEFADQQIDDDYVVEPAGTLPLGATYGRVNVAGMTLLDAEKAVTKHLSTMLADTRVQITWVSPKGNPRGILGSGSQENIGSTLLYDGKTFDQWREMWKTELKTEKRTECIQALAAFGRAGHGKEAAEAILDVAGEYDFHTIDGSAEGKLKEAVINVLSNQHSSQISPTVWLPILMERLELNPDKLRWLTWNLVSRLNTNEPDVSHMLREIYRNQKDQVIRLAAFRASCFSASNGTDFTFNFKWEIAAEGLQDSDPNLVAFACSFIGSAGSHDSSNPEFNELRESWLQAYLSVLTHPDSEVRRWSRNHMPGHFAAEDAKSITEHLISIAKSDSSSKKRIEAIRALAAMKGNARGSLPELTELLKTTTDEETMIALAFAINQVNLSGNESGTGRVFELCEPIIRDSGRWHQYIGDSRSAQRLQDAVAEEERKVLGLPGVSHDGRGGGGRGGGFF